jgi:hypothetical protein
MHTEKKVPPAIEKILAKSGFTCPRGKKELGALGEDEWVMFSSDSGVKVDARVYWDEPPSSFTSTPKRTKVASARVTSRKLLI